MTPTDIQNVKRLVEATPIGKRFFDKVKEDENGCWIWQGAKSVGYGSMWNGERTMGAHRWAYEQFKGKIPEGLHCDHLCRVRACVNPNHLEAVTHQENVRRGVAGDYMKEKSKTITHCHRGHEYTEENTIKKKRGNGIHRTCRECQRAMHRKYLRRVRGKLALSEDKDDQ